jgi:hypothetical protein
MIVALREELEAQEERHATELQQQRQQAAEEIRQLQSTVHAIRAALEAKSG